MESTASNVEREKENIIRYHNQEIQTMKGKKDCLLSSIRTAQNKAHVVKIENDRVTAANVFLVCCSQMMVAEKGHVIDQNETEEQKTIETTCNVHDSINNKISSVHEEKEVLDEKE